MWERERKRKLLECSGVDEVLEKKRKKKSEDRDKGKVWRRKKEEKERKKRNVWWKKKDKGKIK